MDAQGRAGWTTLRPTGSHGLSWPLPLLLDMLGSRNQARAWSRYREQQEAPADTGATQGDYGPLLLSPHQAAGSEHQGRSQATSHAMLPGLGLARCGPAQAREAKGPAASAAEGHGPWLVAASAALVGAMAQTVQARPCGSGRAEAS